MLKPQALAAALGGARQEVKMSIQDQANITATTEDTDEANELEQEQEQDWQELYDKHEQEWEDLEEELTPLYEALEEEHDALAGALEESHEEQREALGKTLTNIEYVGTLMKKLKNP